ncbi:hypothetical protein K0M31_008980 [Melipona bicolor]|uniref:Uncharacterized protein n=1 Tax=Melipona bicolor TaxID=60889 RepID=A0AA40KJB5_9HYME|nr:hypothetical protein K0M31_008980 [Melipona bicolor]
MFNDQCESDDEERQWGNASAHRHAEACRGRKSLSSELTIVPRNFIAQRFATLCRKIISNYKAGQTANCKPGHFLELIAVSVASSRSGIWFLPIVATGNRGYAGQLVSSNEQTKTSEQEEYLRSVVDVQKLKRHGYVERRRKLSNSM